MYIFQKQHSRNSRGSQKNIRVCQFSLEKSPPELLNRLKLDRRKGSPQNSGLIKMILVISAVLMNAVGFVCFLL